MVSCAKRDDLDSLAVVWCHSSAGQGSLALALLLAPQQHPVTPQRHKNMHKLGSQQQWLVAAPAECMSVPLKALFQLVQMSGNEILWKAELKY